VGVCSEDPALGRQDVQNPSRQGTVVRPPFKLDVVCAGPQRTASSWLHRVLVGHPDLCFPRDVKETMFFDERFEKGMPWYEWHFRHRRPGQQCAEVAPTYFDRDEARMRLLAHEPALKVIVNVRNPVMRAFSLYRHHLAKGRVRGSFSEAVRCMPRILASGHYGRFCPLWERAFGADRVLHLVHEDIQTAPDAVIGNVWAFLELPPLKAPAVVRGRVGAAGLPRYPWIAGLVAGTATALRARRLHRLVEIGKQVGLKAVYRGRDASAIRLTPELHAELARTFAADIDYLEARLGRDFSSWRTWNETSGS